MSKESSAPPAPAYRSMLAGLLSLFLPGLGQVFSREYLRGIAIFFTVGTALAIAAWFKEPAWFIIPGILWIWNVWDAIRQPAGAPVAIAAVLWLALAYGIGWQVTEINLGALFRNGQRASSILRPMWEEKYGKSRADTSRVIPQTHRFFAGGGGSVRGWPSRELIARGDPQLGGNFLAEASLESRVNILQSLRDGLWDKIWLVQFLDVGNLWLRGQDIQFTTVAAAIGLGLRYDTAFGPFRIDWGLRVYDPRAPSGQKWITQKKLISQTFNEGAFHFRIGHAF